MNKQLIVLATAAATFAPAAMAQSANPVTLYGRAWAMINSVKATGGALPLRVDGERRQAEMQRAFQCQQPLILCARQPLAQPDFPGTLERLVVAANQRCSAHARTSDLLST